MLVHPDRNNDRIDDAERAVNDVLRCKKLLTIKDGRDHCAKVVKQAQTFVRSLMETQHAINLKAGKSTKLLEDSPEEFEIAVRKRVSVIFADMELHKEQALDKEREMMYIQI